MTKIFQKLMLVSLAGLSALSFVRYYGNVNVWIVDIFSHFPFQYAIIAFMLLCICLWKKTLFLSILAGFLVVFNTVTLVDIGSIAQAAGKGKTTFKVYSANVNRFNEDFSKLTNELGVIKPEILLLMEVTPAHLRLLEPLFQTFPYHVKNTNLGKLHIGSVLFSQFPISGNHMIELSDHGNHLAETTLNIDNRKVMFYAMHASSPLKRKHFSRRNREFVRLAEKIAEDNIPVIVAGDLNETPYSPIFQRFLKISGLSDTRTGFGWQPSWPTYVPLFWLPIDHVLVTPDIQVHDRRTGSHIGSDHYPVIAELSIN